MNDDTKQTTGQERGSSGDASLEARIVAWVLGEASAFEAAELERLVAARPELVLFRRRIEAVHGLLGEAARVRQGDALRLATDRRAVLLAAFGVAAEAAPAPGRTALEAKPGRRRFCSEWKALRLCFGTAAACVLVFFVVSQVTTHFGSRSLMREPVELDAERLKRIRAEAAYEFLQEAREAKAMSEVAFTHAMVEMPSVDYDDATVSSFGEVAILVNRDISTSRGAHVLNLTNLDLPAKDTMDTEPETVPEGDDEIIVLETFSVTDSFTGYLAASSGTGAGGEGFARSSYKGEYGAPSAPDAPAQRDADVAWSTGLADGFVAQTAAAGPVGVGSASGRRSDAVAAATAPPAAPEALSVPPRAHSDRAFVPEDSKQIAVRESDGRGARSPAPVVVPASIDEAHAAQQPVSTFSLHVGDTSFKLAQAALARGELPEAALIRPEEFYNAFDYGDPAPRLGQRVACRIEQAAHPFLQQRTLVRVALKVANTGRGAGQPLRLTVLLDTSGSMEREDRAASVRRATEALASLLGPGDRITLIGFARQPRLIADSLPGDQAAQLLDLVRRTPADGGTNIEEALKLADELAQRQFEASAQNRVVLITDGAANLGDADPARLARRIEGLRGRGIAFDACGVGTDGLDDAILEALTRQGDGRYYVLDGAGDADAGFARQLAGAFRPAAKNVKVQVHFNPARVGAYRIIGFEKHRLREEDFRDDKVDAAELAAEEAAVALYHVEVLPEGEGDLGVVAVRFYDVADGRMVESSWTIAHDRRPRAFDQATPSLRLAGTSALLAEVLRGGAIGDQVDLAALVPVVNDLKSRYAQQPRVQELAAMYEQVRGRLGR